MKFLHLSACFLLLTGCASIINDNNQMVNIVSSNNTPIKGTIDSVPFAGPGVVSINRSKKDKIIMLDTPTCTKQTLMQSSVDNVFWINILTSGPFGSTTDYATEKMWRYQDTVVIPCS